VHAQDGEVRVWSEGRLSLPRAAVATRYRQDIDGRNCVLDSFAMKHWPLFPLPGYNQRHAIARG
jgi:hypothetical protein